MAPALEQDIQFQHTAARRRLVPHGSGIGARHSVSTHSRPKAAGTSRLTKSAPPKRFNTQPPEGGWFCSLASLRLAVSVSTHSRPKAAGRNTSTTSAVIMVSTHSRPKAAGTKRVGGGVDNPVSTHSRPKAAGLIRRLTAMLRWRFNTQPPEGGWGSQQTEQQ